MDWLGVLCFTNLAQERQVGNRAPVDASIKGVLCFTNLARERQAGNRAPTDASIGGHCVLLI